MRYFLLMLVIFMALDFQAQSDVAADVLVFVVDGNLFARNIDTAEGWQLPSLSPYAFSLHSSPQGRLLAYNVGADISHDDGIHLLNLSTGQTSQVLDVTGAGERLGSWSADDRYLSFRLWTGINTAEARDYLYYYDFSLRELVGVFNSASALSLPYFSPDGEQIAFLENSRLHFYDIASRKLVLSQDVGLFVNGNTDLAWHPQGDKIAYLAQDSNRIYQIFAFDVPSQTIAQLSFRPYSVHDFAWSPIGNYLAYTSVRREGASLIGDIFLMDFATGQSEQVTADAFREGDLAWSPSGQYIAYTCTQAASTQLCVLHVESKDVQVLETGDYQHIDGFTWLNAPTED